MLQQRLNRSQKTPAREAAAPSCHRLNEGLNGESRASRAIFTKSLHRHALVDLQSQKAPPKRDRLPDMCLIISQIRNL